MDFRLHIGGHRTGTRHLRKMLLANQAMLEDQGICVPEPKFAERAFGAAVKAIRQNGPTNEISAKLFEDLTGGQNYRRIVMVDPNVSGSFLRPVGKEFFYPRIGNTISRIISTLDDVPLRLFIAVRDPATFIPSCYAEGLRHSNNVSFEEFISETNLQGLRWSDFLHRAQLKDAQVPVTTWRFEDYPYIWRDVVHAITGIKNKEDLVGDTEPVHMGPNLRGATLMHQYLTEHKNRKPGDMERISTAFTQKFPSNKPSKPIPQWPEELTQGMTENYEDDWYYIERMDNVETVQKNKFS